MSCTSCAVPDGWPPDDLATHEQLVRADAQWLGVRADDHQLAAGRQPLHGRCGGVGVGSGGQDDPGAAEGLQRVCDGGVRRAVDVVVRTELLGEVGLTGTAGDGHGLEAHGDCVLHPQVAEAADAEHGDQVARPGGAAPQPVVRGHPRTAQGRRIGRGQRVGDPGQRVCRGDHRLGVTAVVRPSWNLQGLAYDEVALPAGPAVSAAAAEPAHRHPVAHMPALVLRSLAELLDAPGDLMPRDQRKPYARDSGVHEKRVAVADPAGIHDNPYVAWTRLRRLTLDDRERTAGGGDLGDSVGAHLDLSGLRVRHPRKPVEQPRPAGARRLLAPDRARCGQARGLRRRLPADADGPRAGGQRGRHAGKRRKRSRRRRAHRHLAGPRHRLRHRWTIADGGRDGAPHRTAHRPPRPPVTHERPHGRREGATRVNAFPGARIGCLCGEAARRNPGWPRPGTPRRAATRWPPSTPPGAVTVPVPPPTSMAQRRSWCRPSMFCADCNCPPQLVSGARAASPGRSRR